MDYERKMPTYENPNSQWVLKEVKVFDGYTGDGEDYAISRFEYNKPYYDRRERSFYGYGEVKQMQINPQDGTMLRTSVQEYYNEDFFRKSQLKKSTTFDKNGAKVGDAVDNISSLAKNEKWEFQATLNTNETKTCKLKDTYIYEGNTNMIIEGNDEDNDNINNVEEK